MGLGRLIDVVRGVLAPSAEARSAAPDWLGACVYLQQPGSGAFLPAATVAEAERGMPGVFNDVHPY